MKIGIIGTGNVATENYLPVLADMDDVELFYYNRTAEKADAAANKFGGKACASIAELAGQDLDTVFVLTHETQRLSAAQELLSHDIKRVMFEKPLVAKLGQANVCEEDFFDAKELLKNARDKQTETAMIFNYRFLDHVILGGDLIAQRDFGKVQTVNGHIHYACWSHCIDLISHFAGNITEVTALQGKPEYPFADTSATDIAAAFILENQGTGVILGSQSMSFDFPLFDLVFTFENGLVGFRGLDDDMEIQDYRTGKQEVIKVPRNFSRWDQYRATFKKAITAYIDTVRNGEPPPVPGISGLKELQFEVGLKRSAANGKPVILENEFPLED